MGELELSYVQLRIHGEGDRSGAEPSRVRLGPGALIGRLSSAELRFADPNVSEAHALVSLRGRELKLLALRRWFEVGGKRLSDVVLAVGQRIRLAPDVVLEVEAVVVSHQLLALVGIGSAPYELAAAVHAIVARDGGLAVDTGYVPDALAHVSSATDGWVLRTAEGQVVDLARGTTFELAGQRIEVVAIDVGGGASTLQASPSSAPLAIVTRHDTVHIHPAGQPSVVITGISARIITELALVAAPVPWTVVAREIWRGDDDERLLRQNWDRNMRSLRARLRAAGIRDDLVRPDGHGNTELFLLPDDQLTDDS